MVSTLLGTALVILASAQASLSQCGQEPVTAPAASTKRGVAWPTNNPSSPEVFASSKINWLYDWGIYAPGNLGDALSFVPMQWGSAGINQLASEVQSEKPTWVMGFNEPDNGGQANMSPTDAANYWKQYIQPLSAQGIKLVSPAITNGGAPAGTAWMDQFMSACTGCTFDAIACHWYGGWTTDLEAYIETVKKYNKPIWLTEFALSWGNPAAEQSNFLQFLPLALDYLDNEPAIERYSFFGAFYSGAGWDLLNQNGTLNALGQLYVSY